MPRSGGGAWGQADLIKRYFIPFLLTLLVEMGTHLCISLRICIFKIKHLRESGLSSLQDEYISFLPDVELRVGKAGRGCISSFHMG